MARLQGISGGMSGKTGSFTYRQSRGQTIVSQYQPIVKNPNTEGQQNQRAKFKLMSQLAAVMKDGFGTMGVNERPARQKPTQRNAFMQLNFPLVQVTEDSTGVTATIPMEQLKLTSSTKILGEISSSETGVKININNSSVTSVRFVVVDYINNDITRPVVSSVQVVPAASSQATIDVLTPGKHTVLAFGLIPTESATRATLDNLHTPTSQDYFAAIKLNNLVSSGQLVETETLGINFATE